MKHRLLWSGTRQPINCWELVQWHFINTEVETQKGSGLFLQSPGIVRNSYLQVLGFLMRKYIDVSWDVERGVKRPVASHTSPHFDDQTPATFQTTCLDIMAQRCLFPSPFCYLWLHFPVLLVTPDTFSESSQLKNSWHLPLSNTDSFFVHHSGRLLQMEKRGCTLK